MNELSKQKRAMHRRMMKPWELKVIQYNGFMANINEYLTVSPEERQVIKLVILVLSFTQYTQSISLGKCSTIVSNRFTRLSFIIMRGSNIRLPSALRPTGGYSYVVCLAYVVRQLSSIKSDLPKVVNSCFPTTWTEYNTFEQYPKLMD